MICSDGIIINNLHVFLLERSQRQSKQPLHMHHIAKEQHSIEGKIAAREGIPESMERETKRNETKRNETEWNGVHVAVTHMRFLYS